MAYVKTNFSCVGRASGYYADIDTGCELYHMCDGLGRKFSYACPNTTLFQQRMLICDHWYMVNCSKAERDYSANLLIGKQHISIEDVIIVTIVDISRIVGQRDKPFVAEEENELRTPRPDLKDRPYSADYSGESFRRHFKVRGVKIKVIFQRITFSFSTTTLDQQTPSDQSPATFRSTRQFTGEPQISKMTRMSTRNL